jgi:hypothetical protein
MTGAFDPPHAVSSASAETAKIVFFINSPSKIYLYDRSTLQTQSDSTTFRAARDIDTTAWHGHLDAT